MTDEFDMNPSYASAHIEPRRACLRRPRHLNDKEGDAVRRVAICAAVAVAAAGVVTTQATGKPAASKLKLQASDSGGKLKFNKTRLRAKTGKVTIRMTNAVSNSLPHAVEIEGKGIEKKSKVAPPGLSVRLTVRLKKKGTYEFYCPVGQHKQAGMKGKLVVR